MTFGEVIITLFRQLNYFRAALPRIGGESWAGREDLEHQVLRFSRCIHALAGSAISVRYRENHECQEQDGRARRVRNPLALT
jgi:hypothetical protein